MEKLALAVIFLVSVWALVRIIRRSLSATGARRGACCGCPLAGDCAPADRTEDQPRECDVAERASVGRDGGAT